MPQLDQTKLKEIFNGVTDGLTRDDTKLPELLAGIQEGLDNHEKGIEKPTGRGIA